MENIHEVAQATARIGASSLRSKNIRIHNRRTSIRLEPEMWEALHEIAAMEGCSIHDLCSAISDGKQENSSFTAALRVFLMIYYRSAALAGRQISFVQKRLKENGDVPKKPFPANVTLGNEHKPTATYHQ